MLSVFEIEQLIERLGYQIQLGDEDGKAQTGIDNWQTVLRNYRKSTTESEDSVETVVSGMLNKLNVVLRSLKESPGKEKTLAGLQKDFGETTDKSTTYGDFLEKGLQGLDGVGWTAFRPDPDPVGRVPWDASTKSAMDYSISVLNEKLVKFTNSNCGNGDAFGLGDLCQTKKKIQKHVDLAESLLGICDFGDALKDQDTYAPVVQFCKKPTASVQQGDNLPGLAGAFDFLDNEEHVLTFSGGGSVLSLTYAFTQADAMAHTASMSVERSNSYNGENHLCVSAGRRRGRRRLDDETTVKGERWKAELTGCRRLGVDFGSSWDYGLSDSVTVNIGRTSARSKGHRQSVRIEFGDADEADLFALHVLADKHYGTPIFRTIGGETSCPGESGTSKVDSRVTIEKFNYDYCQSDLCLEEPYAAPSSWASSSRISRPRASRRTRRATTTSTTSSGRPWPSTIPGPAATPATLGACT